MSAADLGATPDHVTVVRGDYGVTCRCGVMLEWPPGWAHTDEAARRVINLHSGELTRLQHVEAALAEARALLGDSALYANYGIEHVALTLGNDTPVAKAGRIHQEKVAAYFAQPAAEEEGSK